MKWTQNVRPKSLTFWVHFLFENYLLKSTLTFFLASWLSASNNSTASKWNIDAIIFEGGIGEHNFDVVNKCVEGLEPLGIVFDSSHNDEEVYEGIISKPESKIKMYVIQTNEELEIAKETMELVK